MTPKPSRTVKLKPVDPLDACDAEIRDLQARIAKIQHRLDTCDKDTLFAEGDEMGRAIGALETQLREARTRRVRIFAGIPEPAAPTPLPTTKAVLPPLPRKIKFAESLTNSGDDGDRAIHVAAEFLDEIRSSAAAMWKSPNAVASYTQGRDTELDLGIAILRGRSTQHQERFADLEARLAEMQARLEAAEQRVAKGTLQYEGIWREDAAYERGATVTCGGNLWVALKDVAPDLRPGGNDSWQLAVKRGRDGRDADSGARKP